MNSGNLQAVWSPLSASTANRYLGRHSGNLITSQQSIVPKGFYFAYGSNMDRQQMDQRRPAASLASTGWLNNYGFKIDGRVCTTIVEQEKSRVRKVTWQLTVACELAIDRYESVPCSIFGRKY